jgi:uncharacterized protein DUF2800
MSEWRACNRCTYVEGVCKRCGRPAGTAKGWKPPRYEITGQTGVEAVESDLVPSAPEPESAVEAAPPPVPFSAAAASTQSASASAASSAPTRGHSPLGGSAASRYMACSGSVALIQSLKGDGEADEPQEEWTAEGSLAHLLGAHCLDSGIQDTYSFIGGEGKWEAVTIDMAESVKTYIDYVFSRPGQRLVEYHFHVPSVHPLSWGAIDAVCYSPLTDGYLEFIDFKNGAGVVVAVEGNKQMLHYAGNFIAQDRASYPDAMLVTLTIVQPNAWHAGGAIRSWTTTVGEIMRWLAEELVPAMHATQKVGGWFLDIGEHCRFCPAKLVCPAYSNLAMKALADADRVLGQPIEVENKWRPALSFDQLDTLYSYLSSARKWYFSHLMAGENPNEIGAKLVYGKSSRDWKEGAMEVLIRTFGGDAYSAPELKSPAQIEKLPGGKALVTQLAYKIDGGPTVASLSDKGTPYLVDSASQLYGQAVAKALAKSEKA